LLMSLLREVQAHELPAESSGGGEERTHSASSSSNGGSSEAKAAHLQTQISELETARQAVFEVRKQKDDLQRQLELLKRDGTDGTSSATAGTPGCKDEGGAPPEGDGKGTPAVANFGRRAPPMPTRQGTSAMAASPMIGQASGRLQAENMGQVTPMGVSPIDQQRGGANSAGRRRSRLAGDSFAKVEEGIEAGAEGNGGTDT